MRRITRHICELKALPGKNQFWMHFSASGCVRRGNVDICPKMGHMIPDGDGPHQPTNAADTSLSIQRLFIGADSAGSQQSAAPTNAERETAYGGTADSRVSDLVRGCE